eukprot:TRINITY_DN4956_c1_g1_i1.p1 TRINITY_DN4956_c1_g1~~TRINITY_DN4956_c1_g1_i1.p1  ORF type:complete len:290 (+),score=46.76 TRINITY_DN4956_c1_g1_i1:50-919(+)
MTSNSEYGSFYSRSTVVVDDATTAPGVEDNLSNVSAGSGVRGEKKTGVKSLQPVVKDDDSDGMKHLPAPYSDECPMSPLGHPDTYQTEQLRQHITTNVTPLHDVGLANPEPPQGIITSSKKRTEREILTANLERFGFVETKVPADGNCQFRSISWYIYGTDEKHEETRKLVMKHMAAHKELYFFFIEGGEEGYQKYIKKMSRINEWGDHLTMQAAADALQVQIRIVTSHAYKDSVASNHGGSIICVKPRDETGKERPFLKEVWVSFCEEHLAEHYNPVSKIRAPSTPRP